MKLPKPEEFKPAFPHPMVETNILFKGKKFVLIGGKKDGAITTRKAYENFDDSFAHLCKDGIVRRHGLEIGTKEDIKFKPNEK